MKQFLRILILGFAVIFYSCNSGGISMNPPKTKSPDELKRELKVQEQAAPLKYISVENTSMNPNKTRNAGLFHGAEYDGYIVQGTIRNSATIAKFKDVVLSIKLMSKTNTIIDTKEYTIYEFFPPNSTKAFAIKVNPPEVTAQYNISVKNATATE